MVKVAVKLGLDAPHSSSLYYFLRSLDVDGKGWVVTSMSFLSSLFSISKNSIKRRLKRAVAEAFIYQFEINQDRLWVKYSSHSKLKQLVYVDNFASGHINTLSLFRIDDYKKALYELAISAQQSRCEKAISKGETSSRRILNPYKYINSNCASGCDYRIGDKLFVKGYINIIGASQITLAEYLDKARSTLIKWCNKFPSLKLWKKKKYISDNPSPDIYEIYKVDKLGRKRRVQYKRMPNYYFVNSDSSNESKLRHKVLSTPSRLFHQSLSQKELNESNIQYLKGIKRTPNGKRIGSTSVCSITDKLLFWFDHSQLVSLTRAFTFWVSNEDVSFPIEAYNKFSAFQIADALERFLTQHSHVEMDMFLLMVKRLRKGQNPRPPYLDYQP